MMYWRRVDFLAQPEAMSGATGRRGGGAQGGRKEGGRRKASVPPRSLIQQGLAFALRFRALMPSTWMSWHSCFGSCCARPLSLLSLPSRPLLSALTLLSSLALCLFGSLPPPRIWHCRRPPPASRLSSRPLLCLLPSCPFPLFDSYIHRELLSLPHHATPFAFISNPRRSTHSVSVPTDRIPTPFFHIRRTTVSSAPATDNCATESHLAMLANPPSMSRLPHQSFASWENNSQQVHSAYAAAAASAGPSSYSRQHPANSWAHTNGSSSSSSSLLPPTYAQQSKSEEQPLPTPTAHITANGTTIYAATGRKRKRLQKACVACHKAKRRCDGGLPCSNCDFSGRTCCYS